MMCKFEDFCCARYDFVEQYERMYGVMPRTVTFIVTESCNLRCTYCYQHNKTARVMPLETAKKCVDALFKADAENSEYINPDDANGLILDFIGGEPMLEIDLISDIVDYFLTRAIELDHRWATRYMISMSSNGTLYFDENVQRFMARHAGRVSVGITLDGDEALHDSCRRYPDGRGSYADAAAAFKDIIARHGQSGTKLTLAPANVDKLADAAIHMFTEFEISELNANCVFEEGWRVEHARILYDQLKRLADWLIDNDLEGAHRLSMFDCRKYRPMDHDDNQNWCGGTGKMLAFGVNGEIYPCQRYSPASLGPDVRPLIVGDAAHGIEVTPDEKAVTEMLRKIDRRSQSTDECWDCPIAAGCAWCSAYNYEKFGTPDRRATFICPMHKATALANAYFWNRLAIKHDMDERFEIYLPREKALEIIDPREYDMLLALAAPRGGMS